MIAEWIWAYFEVIAGIDVPYPSIADIFWLVGYVPLILAMLVQFRVYQTTPNRRQRVVIGMIVLFLSAVIGGAVVLPILQGFDPERIPESLINLAYPLLDLVLLILTVVIIFSLEQGRFGFTWRLLGLGLVATTAADILFSYASWYELYDPAGKLNAITLASDMLFYLSYLVLGLGAYSYKFNTESISEVKINLVLQSLTKTNLLLFLDKDGKIISMSDNFLDLVKAPMKEYFLKKPLDLALQTDGVDVQSLIARTLERGSLSTVPIKVKDSNGNLKDVWMTSFAVHDDEGKFVCIAVVLRTLLGEEAGQGKPLTEEQRLLIDHYLNQAGGYRSDENQVIKTYFLEQIRLLYSLIQQFNGSLHANRLFEHLARISDQNNWQFTFEEHKIGMADEYEGETLARRIAILLREARDYAAEGINSSLVEHEMRLLDQNLSPESLGFLDKYHLRESARATSQASSG